MKDYPQLSVRLPSDVKAKLDALSLVSARPQWRLIAEAIECYLRERSDVEQEMVADLVARSRLRGVRTGGRKTDS